MKVEYRGKEYNVPKNITKIVVKEDSIDFVISIKVEATEEKKVSFKKSSTDDSVELSDLESEDSSSATDEIIDDLIDENSVDTMLDKFSGFENEQHVLIVKNISSRTRQNDINDAFGRFNCKNARLFSDDTAIVCFDNDQDLQSALENMNGRTLDGKKLDISIHRSNSDEKYTLSIERVSKRTREKDLDDLFSKFDCKSTRIFGDGSAMVFFKCKEDLEDAYKTTNGMVLDCQKLRLSTPMEQFEPIPELMM